MIDISHQIKKTLKIPLSTKLNERNFYHIISQPTHRHWLFNRFYLVG
jgi:hypothetical protein